jgi:hypothetical protein
MSAEEPDRYANVPLNWRERGGAIAPPSHHAHPEPGRSATGWYVLILLTAAALIAIWLSVGNWRPDGLADRADDAVDLRIQYEELRTYTNELSEQNEQMGQMPRLVLAAPDRPVLEQNIFTRRRNFNNQRQENETRCNANPTPCRLAQEERAEIQR